jgi:hypothetical protein
MLLMSLIVSNMYAAADTQLTGNLSALALNADCVNPKELAARRLNSLMEAYMEGKFAASKNEACLKYDDYESRADQEENWAFEDTVKEINDQLIAMYSPVSHVIDGWRPLNFHMTLLNMKKKDKISYLQGLQEVDKVHIQALRLYDFLKVMNMDLPASVLKELQKIADNKELSEDNKADMIKKLMDPQDEAAKSVKANRLVLAKAVKAGDAAQVLEACKKPLHIASFVPLNVAIAKMIADIEVDEDNVLLSNESRATQGCIIS